MKIKVTYTRTVVNEGLVEIPDGTNLSTDEGIDVLDDILRESDIDAWEMIDVLDSDYDTEVV